MGIYKVSFDNNIVGGSDSTYIIADSEEEALKKGKYFINTHKLIPDFLNTYGRYNVEKV